MSLWDAIQHKNDLLLKNRKLIELTPQLHDKDIPVVDVLQCGDDIRIHGNWVTFFRINHANKTVEYYDDYHKLREVNLKQMSIPVDSNGTLLKRGDLVYHTDELGQIRFFIPNEMRAEVSFKSRTELIELKQLRKKRRFVEGQSVECWSEADGLWNTGRIEEILPNVCRISFSQYEEDYILPDAQIRFQYQKYLEGDRVICYSSDGANPKVSIDSYEELKDLYHVSSLKDQQKYEVFSSDVIDKTPNPDAVPNSVKFLQKEQDNIAEMMNILEHLTLDPKYRQSRAGKRDEQDFRAWLKNFLKEAKKMKTDDVFKAVIIDKDFWDKFREEELARIGE